MIPVATRFLRALVLVLVAACFPAGQLCGEEKEFVRGSDPFDHVDVLGSPLPRHSIARLGNPRLRHRSAVYSVAFSPDGTLISGSSDKTIRFWNALNGDEVKRFVGHLSSVKCVAISSSGRLLASAGNDKVVRLWDVATAKLIRVIPYPTYLHTVVFSPDDKFLAFGGKDNTVRLWDVKQGAEVRKFLGHTRYIESLDFSPDGKTLASGSSDNTARLWDVATGKELRVLRGHLSYVYSVAFSPQGKSLATGSKDKTIRLWDVDAGAELRKLEGHQSYVHSVAFSPDGRTVASASRDKSIRIWDVKSGLEQRALWGHLSYVNSVAYSPDGKSLASGSNDGSIRLWEVATGQRRIGCNDAVRRVQSLAFSPDGDRLAVGNTKTVTLLDVRTERVILTLTGHRSHVTSATFSPDGKLLATGGYLGVVCLWDLTTGAKVREFKGEGPIYALAFSPNGKTLAIPGLIEKDGRSLRAVIFFNAITGDEVHYLRVPNLVTIKSAAFSPNGAMFAAQTEIVRLDDGRIDFVSGVRLWNLSPAPKLIPLRGDDVVVASYRAASNRGFTSLPRRIDAILYWNVATERTLYQLNTGPIVAFSRNGQSLLSAAPGSTLRRWEVATGKPIPPPKVGLAWSIVLTRSRGRTDELRLSSVWGANGFVDRGILSSDELKPSQSAQLWRSLAEPDAVRAHWAIRRFVAAPKQAVAFLRGHIRPEPVPDIQQLERFVADLDHDKFIFREKATEELRKLGAAAEGALEKALANAPSPEVSIRVTWLLAKLRSVLSPYELRMLRAVEILEHLGTSEAESLLDAMTKFSTRARLTVEAKAAMQRLAQRTATRLNRAP